MIGQSSLKYEIFPKLHGLDQIDVEKIIQQQIIKPIENQDENFYLYGINMKNQVSLQYLMECIPFIKITFGQLLMILRDVILKIKAYIILGFIPEQLSINNVYLILKDMQLTYFYQKLNYNIDIIGVKWIKQVQPNKYILDKYESIVKNFVLQIFTLFKSKYEMKIGQQYKYLLEQFFNNYHTNHNSLEYIKQFLLTSKCNVEKQLFLQEENSLRKEYNKFNTQIKEGQNIIDTLILSQQQLITQLENNYTQTILSSLKAHMYSVLYNLLYQEIDDFFKSNKISAFNDKLDSMLSSFNQIIKFDNKTMSLLFQNEYQKQFSLKEHFSKYYKLEENWVSTLKFDFINSYFMIAGQSTKLNMYVDLIKSLNYIKNFEKDQQTNQSISFQCPIQLKNFEQILICLLQKYTEKRIDQLF